FRTGIAVDFAEGGHLAGCKFIGNSIALFVGDAASGMQVTHSDFRHNAAGLQLYATQASNEWLISACHFESNTGTAVSLAGAQSWAFVRCKWEGNAAHVALEWPNSNNVSLRPDGHQFIGGTFNRTAGTAPGMTVDHGTLL